MPQSPLKPCTYPGCPNLVRFGYCDKHQKKAVKIEARTEPEHIEEHQRLYDRRWKKVRAAWLADKPWCEICLDYGKYVPAEDVHHVIPHRGNVSIFRSGPLQSLCHTCHSRITRYELVSQDDGSYYPLILARFPMPVYMVSGAPGSGKSTFVSQNAGVGSAVIDLDLIIQSITGMPIYTPVSKAVVNKAFQKRNQLLVELQQGLKAADEIWFILSGWRTSDRRIWCDILQPEKAYVIMTSEEECIRRIRCDIRRGRVATEQCEAVHKWFELFSPRADEVIIQSDDDK